MKRHPTKPYRYFVLYRDDSGKLKQFNTDHLETGLKKEGITEGTLYVDTRYKAKLRLWGYLLRKTLYN